jgi:tRNA G18 (ribose-2'-O)-methylase SpoU
MVSLRDCHLNLPRHDLIICAALVQNPANLGALCRTAEAFRLKGLVLPDLAIAQTAAFRNLAASTHHWQPLLACDAVALLEWMKQAQQEGYSLIALHADPGNDAAIALSQFAFPRQSLLVLGRELTGIPAQVLAECDRIVTILQFGRVQSLNVQTAAAIAIYEYVRQHADQEAVSARPTPR